MNFELKPYQAPDFKQERFTKAPDACFKAAEKDGVVPEGFHATSIYPEYFKKDGQWLLAEESRMDCVAVLKDNHISVIEPRSIRKGDLVCVGRKEDGSEGIFLWTEGFKEEKQKQEAFSFRRGHSRESSFTKDYDEIYDLLRYEKQHGKIVWVLGPAFAFDQDARHSFARLIENGYVDAVLAGNALATHDLEAAYRHTALGQNIYTGENVPNGHYHHLETLNRIRSYGSIRKFIQKENIDNGIMYALDKKDIPYVLAGSIRDDGPMPEIYGNVYEAQNAMRAQIKDATTVICMATALHTIATGNMTPSYRVMPDGSVRQVYFYVVDISEFLANKLADRGSLSSRSIITNVQDFIVNVAKALDVY